MIMSTKCRYSQEDETQSYLHFSDSIAFPYGYAYLYKNHNCTKAFGLFQEDAVVDLGRVLVY